MRYGRIVLKLSGEFMGEPHSPLAPDRFRMVCESIELLTSVGTQVCVVAGGGNMVRGNQCADFGIEQSAADEVGMIATGVNAKMLAAMLGSRCEVHPTILSNGPCTGFGEQWHPDRAIDLLQSGWTPIVAGGWGVPYVSTDYPAVGFAAQIGADAVLMAKSGTDGIYDRDPAGHSDAMFLAELTVAEALARRIEVMDRSALEFARDHAVNIHVFSAIDPETPARIIKGDNIGSVVLS